jgi:16S rRNA (cytidine1402-2'-O)-methyltransferase
MQAGESVALVTDAGTPGISDPGAELVAACRSANVPVDPVPGASAALVAAVGSGFPLNSVTFLGFPPIKAKARRSWLEGLAGQRATVVFFEAPHRIGPTLTELGTILGNRQICVARELTKAHQEFVRGAADSDSFRFITRKGEFSVVIGPSENAVPQARAASDDEISAAFRAIDESSMASGRRRAAGEVAKRFGLTTNEVYRAIERTKL